MPDVADDDGRAVDPALDVVVVEGWYRGSHARWADAVRDRSHHHVRLLTLPGVHWRWRLHGGPVRLARDLDAALAQRRTDAVVVSSSVDASALVGLGRRRLGRAAVLVYLHENQLTFPRPPGVGLDHNDAMATWRSMLAADAVVVNSQFHRDELLAALPGFLRSFPDFRDAALVEEVRERMHVVGVGIEVAPFRRARAQPSESRPVPRIVWNHRWEHDKGVEVFVDALVQLRARRVPFEVVVVGSHLPVEQAVADLAPVADRVIHVGAVDRADYPAMVAGDVVVSTARHEFYGVAVREAVAAGCAPVVPDGLVHPELVPASVASQVCYRDDPVPLLEALLLDAERRRRVRAAFEPVVDSWDVGDCVRALDTVIADTVASVR